MFTGGGLLAKAKDQSDVNLGQTVIIIGLVVQIVWFGGFILVSAVFHYRMRVVPIVIEKNSWRTFMYALYAASTMIMVRSVFRVVEYAGGNDGYLMRSEVVSNILVPSLNIRSEPMTVALHFRFSSYGWGRHSVQHLPS